MKIVDVEVLTLRYDYPDQTRHLCAEGAMGSRVTSLVRVTTDTGLVGIGSAYSHPDLVQLIIEGHLAPFLIGQDPGRINELWDRMYSLTRWYGRKGAAISALGAVDIALWDLLGKATSRPVYQLLGGHSPDVTAYASGLLWQDDMAQLAAEAIEHVDAGFGLMKMRLGRSNEYDMEAVQTVTRAIQGAARLAVDGTHRYTLETATSLGEYLSEIDAAWFEEPFPPEDIDAYSALSSRIDVPIAAGENEFGVQGFRELFRSAAVGLAQPDVSRAGGITECMRIARLAHESGIPIATHTWSDAVALTANSHLVAASPNGWAVEVDRTGTPFMDDLLAEPLEIVGGSVHLSDRPGLGIDLDPEVLKQLTVPRGQLMGPGNYADLVFGNQAYDSVGPSARTEYRSSD